MIVAHNSHVLVADGRKSLFFRNEGDAERMNLQMIDGEEQKNPADRDQKSDAAGRASSPQGASNSSMGETDFHQQEEDRFAAGLADDLRRRTLSGEIEKLVIVAPPKTLGELRKHLHGEVERRVSAQIPKDLTGHPVDQIQRILAAAE